MKTVDVVVTTYKRDFSILEEAINSVLSQTYPNINIAVVNDNDNDTDISKEIDKKIKKYGNKIKYYNYKGNHGACYARNYGSDKLDGQYIAFLDDDDIWHSDKIEKQVEALEKNNAVMVMCDATYKIYKNDNKNIIREMYVQKTNNDFITLNSLLNSNIIGGCSNPLIRKDIFVESGKFTENLPSAQDYDLWIRIVQRGKVFHIKESLIDFKIKNMERISGNIKSKIIGYEHLINSYSNLSNDPTQFKVNKYFQLGCFCSENNDFKLGKYYLKYALNQKYSLSNLMLYIKKSIYYKLVKIKRRCCNGKK